MELYYELFIHLSEHFSSGAWYRGVRITEDALYIFVSSEVSLIHAMSAIYSQTQVAIRDYKYCEILQESHTLYLIFMCTLVLPLRSQLFCDAIEIIVAARSSCYLV